MKQDVAVNLTRFRPVLLQALDKLQQWRTGWGPCSWSAVPVHLLVPRNDRMNWPLPTGRSSSAMRWPNWGGLLLLLLPSTVLLL